MPKRAEREYRALNMKEMRASNTEGEYIVEGYAATFDEPYELGLDGFKECIKHEALEDADLTDVIFQYDHAGLVLARQRNNTLEVKADGHGLWVRADLGGSETGRSLHEAIKNGLVDKMSWGFVVAEDGWDYDNKTRTSFITKVSKVFDVSAVSIPANEDTEINARSYFNGVIEAEQQELLQRKQEQDRRHRLALRIKLLK